MPETEPEPLVVRPARPDDADHVWPLARDFATSFTPRRAAFEATWTALTATPTALVAVAQLGDGTVVGYLLAHADLTFLANGPVAWIEEVMVAAEHRRRGVGRALMAHAERWAHEQGAAYIALASRRAGAFYTALGYDDSAVFYRRDLPAGR